MIYSNSKKSNLIKISLSLLIVTLIKYIFESNFARDNNQIGTVIFFVLSIFAITGFYYNKDMTMGLLRLEADEHFIIFRLLFLLLCSFILVECIDSLVF